MTLNSEGLLPCPFCGGAAEIEHSIHEDNHRAPRDFHHVRVICGDCEVAQVWLEFGEMMDSHREQPEAQVEAERKAIAAWNRRALPPVDGLEVVAWDVAPKGLPAEPTKSHSFVVEIEKQGGSITPLVTLSQASSVIAGLKEANEALMRERTNMIVTHRESIDRLTSERDEASAEIDAACNDLRSFMTTFVRENFPDNKTWKPLPDLLGMLSQMDNASTITRDYRDRISSIEEQNKRLREALNQSRLAFSGYVSPRSAIDMIDALGDHNG